MISLQGFDAWREDRETKTPNKTTALVQVTAFLDSIKPKEEEDEGVQSSLVGGLTSCIRTTKATRKSHNSRFEIKFWTNPCFCCVLWLLQPN